MPRIYIFKILNTLVLLFDMMWNHNFFLKFPNANEKTNKTTYYQTKLGTKIRELKIW